MHCPNCGFAVTPQLYRCGSCGALLPPPPGVTPDRLPVPSHLPAAPAVQLADGIGQTAMVFLWLSAAMEIATLTVFAVGVQPWENAVPQLVFLPLPVLALALATLCVQLLTRLMLIVWLYNVSSNLEVFTGVNATIRPAWAVAAWFVPVANLVLPPMVIANVARGSAYDPSGVEGEVQARRVWRWWILDLLRLPLGLSALMLFAPLVFMGLRWVRESTILFVAIGVGPGILINIVVAVLACRVIGGIDVEQRQRVERAWGPSLQLA